MAVRFPPAREDGEWLPPMFCAVAGRRSFSGGKEMQIIIKGISEIKPYENNPRNNDSAVAVCFRPTRSI